MSASVLTDRTGLSVAEAAERLAVHGPNLVASGKEETLWDEFLESLREPLVLLLLLVGGLYFAFGELRDALIVLGVIIAVAVTEAGIEWRAGRAVAALAALAQPKALVWRDGLLSEQPIETLVPGDVVELRAGSRIPADARLIAAQDLAVDESLVTGESEPVSHASDNPSMADLLGGTVVVRGAGQAVVTRTGKSSALGKIASLVATTKEPKTPMQRRMSDLARTLLWAALAVSVIIPVIGVLARQPAKEMLLTGLSLAFATIPEELPVLIIVVLGLGSLKLARRGAIIRRIRAAETLGAVTIICTDKTGTLTLNSMALSRAAPAVEMVMGCEVPASDQLLLRAAALASEAGGNRGSFDPMDAAIRAAANDVSGTEHFPFDQTRRMSSGYAAAGAGFDAGAKGAPEAVLARCSAYRGLDEVRPLDERARTALTKAAAAYGRGGRVLGVASRSIPFRPASRDDAETELIFEGVVVLSDPVRPEVPRAVAALGEAGVAISVITGDQPTTALAVAVEAGIPTHHRLIGGDLAELGDEALAKLLREGAVVARAQPADKLRIVRVLIDAGSVVMVTGDGVNDAPALRAASVGVAMGRVGSDAARETADVVLTNDSFAILVEAIREGRCLFDNFRKAIRFYLAVKLALILISAVAAILQYALPFSPVQIVILELFMDLGAALAYVSQPADKNVMARPPRDPDKPFFERSMVAAIVAGALTLASIVLAAFLFGLRHSDLAQARTLALVAWFCGHAALGFVMAFDDGVPRFGAVLKNPMLLAWLAASMAFAVIIVLLPSIGEAIGAGPVQFETAVSWGMAAILIPQWLMLWLGRAGVRPAGRLSKAVH